MKDATMPQFISGQSLRVESAYDLDVVYHIVLGQFKWPSEQRSALHIFLQKGEASTYPEALEKGEILSPNPLVLEEDLEEVLKAITTLRG